MKKTILILLAILACAILACAACGDERWDAWLRWGKMNAGIQYWSNRAMSLKKQAAACKQEDWESCGRLRKEVKVAEYEIWSYKRQKCVALLCLQEMGEIGTISSDDCPDIR